MSVIVLADGDGQHVVVTGAQGPLVRVVSEEDSADAMLVGQGCRTVRAGQLG